MRKILLSHQKNVRDIGGLTGFNGKKVKEGRIYRGGFLGKLSPEDIEIIKSLHLTDVVDFRGTIEYNARPDYRFEGVNYHNFPTIRNDEELKNKNDFDDSNLLWFLDGTTDGVGHMKRTYKEIVFSEIGQSGLKNFFKLLSKDNIVVYYHCSQGKDRAGLASYLLEIALGVSKEDALNDYLLSNEAMSHKIVKFKEELKDKPFYNEQYEKNLEGVFTAKEEYVIETLALLEEKYGSIERYLKDVLEVDINRLRELYLEH